MLGVFWRQGPVVPFNDDWRKESIFEETKFNFEWGILYAFLVEYGLVNLVIVLKRCLGIGLSKFYKIRIAFAPPLCCGDSKASS